MREMIPSKRPGCVTGTRLLAWAVTLLMLAACAAPAAAQGVTRSRVEDRVTYSGGYLPPGGFARYSGAPLGGYTPWGYQGPEGGWLKLHYAERYVEFGRSYSFGEETVGGSRSLTTSYFPIEYQPHPLEYGRGPWNSYGATQVNPEADIWKRQGLYGRVPPR